MYLLRMAFRNIWRNKRRTVLNLVAFGINITFLIFFVSFFRGRIEKTYTNATKYITGHIQIHNVNYEREERRMPLDLTIAEADKISSIIEEVPDVVFVGRRIEFGMFASNGNDQLPCMGIAVEPEKEAKFNLISKSVVKGRYITRDDNGILLGRDAAELLNLRVGDVLMVLARTRYSTPNLIDAEITGIFATGFPMIDKVVVFFPISLARELLQMEDEPTEIMIGLTDRKTIPAVLEDINNSIPESIKRNISISRWENYAKAMVADVKSDSKFMAIFLMILIAIAVFGMSNTMSMSIFERTREIGTMRAMGMGRKQIVRLFILEAIIVSLFGVAIGCIGGGLLGFYVEKVGIPIGKVFESEMVNVPFGDRLHGKLEAIEFIGSIVLGIVCGLIGGLPPALRASRLKVTDALREV